GEIQKTILGERRKIYAGLKEENERWQDGCEEGLGEILAETEKGGKNKNGRGVNGRRAEKGER
ncbi:MAG: hypothetical protein ACLUFF_02365, partial [Acutalibacteraceae bacterium]